MTTWRWLRYRAVLPYLGAAGLVAAAVFAAVPAVATGAVLAPSPPVTPTADSTGDATGGATEGPSVTTQPTATESTATEPATTTATTPASPDTTGRLAVAAAVTTTSGFLRDARTGAPLRNSCVAWVDTSTSPVSPANWVNVQFDGSWSIVSDQAGPFALAFYVTSNGDCSGPMLSNPVPTWYLNQPVAQNVPNTLVPPAEASPVPAGTSGLTVCLDEQGIPSSCATPDAVVSGTVVKLGPVPVEQACVFLLGAGGAFAQAITDPDGNWRITGVPVHYPMVIGVVPPFVGVGGPCQSNGPPPVPGPGELQPEMYANTWVDLSDPNLLSDPFAWGLEHGANAVTNNNDGLVVCLTTDAGTVDPRPGCEVAPAATTSAPTNPPSAAASASALTAGASSALPGTGTAGAAYLATALALLTAGLVLVLLAGLRGAGHRRGPSRRAGPP